MTNQSINLFIGNQSYRFYQIGGSSRIHLVNKELSVKHNREYRVMTFVATGLHDISSISYNNGAFTSLDEFKTSMCKHFELFWELN